MRNEEIEIIKKKI